MNSSHSEEEIVLVDEQDVIIGAKERSQIIEDTDRYRVSALWIINENNEVLVARRALQKRVNPGKWGPAVAGTVSKDETYIDCVKREAFEELGLNEIPFLAGPKSKITLTRKYFAQWFVAVWNGDPSQLSLQKEEVMDVRWISQDELQEIVSSKNPIYLRSFIETAPEINSWTLRHKSEL